MSHGPEHQIEHAEHAAHAAHNEYDKRVTISIAVIAALLACVTMLGHRAHSETLQLKTLATHKATEAANKWAYYQSKNLFLFESELMLDQMSVFAGKGDSKEMPEAMQAKYQKIVDKYKKRLPDLEDEAKEIVEKGRKYLEESEHVHARADRYDYGELALQLAVVLSSLSILTKGRGFWYSGLVSAAVGCLIALTGVFDLFLGGH